MKKFLLATAAVLASTSAYAADYAVVHPFYTPAQGKFVSSTEYNYTHAFKGNKNGQTPKTAAFDREFAETLKYGVTNDIQVGLSLSRTWGQGKVWDDTNPMRNWEQRTYTNSWELSVGYNVINDGKAFLNAGLAYSQDVSSEKPTGWRDDEHAKNISLQVNGGYNLDAVTVFGSIRYDRQIDGEKEDEWLNRRDEKDSIYTLEAGVFKAFNDQISARTSLSADIDATKGDKQRTYWWNVGADYSFNKNMAVGLNASYMLEDDVRGKRYDWVNDMYVSRKGDELHSAYKVGIDFTIGF